MVWQIHVKVSKQPYVSETSANHRQTTRRDMTADFTVAAARNTNSTSYVNVGVASFKGVQLSPRNTATMFEKSETLPLFNPYPIDPPPTPHSQYPCPRPCYLLLYPRSTSSSNPSHPCSFSYTQSPCAPTTPTVSMET